MQGVWREIAYYGRVLKELVFPRRCIVCGYGIETGYVCEQCRRNYLLQRVLKGEPREEYLAGQAEPVAQAALCQTLRRSRHTGDNIGARASYASFVRAGTGGAQAGACGLLCLARTLRCPRQARSSV